MKKTLLLFGISLLAVGNYTAQSDKIIEKLRVMYAEEDYQDCAYSAIKYADKDKYKDDPQIYVYASMACLRISQTNEGSTDFKKAFADALSYAGKYRKKDKSGGYYNEYITHFEELKQIVAEEVENYMLEERKEKLYKSAKKSLSLMNKIHKLDPNDKGAYLLLAVLEMQVKNTMEGKKMLKVIMPEIKKLSATADDMPLAEELDEKELAKRNKKIEAVFGGPMTAMKPFDEMTEMEQVFLRLGLIEYAEYMYGKKKYEEAKEIIEIGKPFFYNENELYLRKYNMSYKDCYKKIAG